MYTEQEARQAIGKRQLQEFSKRLAFRLHEYAIQEQSTYNLPYRVLIDYYKADRDFMEVHINPYYPYPAIPKEYDPPQWDYERDLGYTQSEWVKLLFGKPCTGLFPPEVKAKIEKWEQEQVIKRMGKPYTHVWDLQSKQGQRAWFYWFMVFILPYADDIPGWNSFDLYGDTQHTEQEVKERKRYYMGLIKKCKENPDTYKHEVQRKDITDYDKYAVHECYMWRDDIGKEAEPPAADNALAIMYRERDLLRAKYGERYGQESTDRYSIVFRLEKIIKELEKGGKDNG